MIVPMKEVTLAAARSEQAATLRVLQDAGVVHLVEAPAAGGDGLAVTRARLASARRAADVLAASAPDPVRGGRRGRPPAPGPDGGSAGGSASGSAGGSAGVRAGSPVVGVAGDRSVEHVVAEVERLAGRLDDLRRTQAELEEERARLSPFGAFDPAAVRRLHDDGIGVRLARPTIKTVLPEVEDATWVELGRDRRLRALALVGPREAVAAADVPDEIDLPVGAPARLEGEIAQVDAELRRTRERLAALAVARADVERWVRRAEDAVRFEEARAAMQTVGAVAVLRGFVPVDEIRRLQALAHQHGWGLWIADVLEIDAAPTLIRNPRWVKPIEPLFSFLGVVPAYGQVDISVPFLIFFGIFFAMIVGDAGYGLLFLALTEVARRRLPASAERVVRLMRVLSIGTIVWGIASGNYFGIAVLPPALTALRLDWLAEERNMIALAFTIGVVHLTLAHGWNIVRYINTTRALVEAGWVATTWTMYFLARQLVLGDPFPDLAWVSLGVGVVLIATFITPWRRLRSEWFTHAMLPLNLVSNFVDVVSYVRLFAVGAATFAVAESFNALAMSIGLGGVLGGLVSALVLFFGHTLNVLLAAMGVLVHGVRLNTLEFAGHLGMSWTGHPYRPFARTIPMDGEGDPSWTPR